MAAALSLIIVSATVGSSSGAKSTVLTAPGASTGEASRARGATVTTLIGASSLVCSCRLPPHRSLVISHSGPVSISMQFATIGRSRRAATCAMTSLPFSVPVARTASACTLSMSCTMVEAQASGPKSDNISWWTRWMFVAPCSASTGARPCDFSPMSTQWIRPLSSSSVRAMAIDSRDSSLSSPLSCSMSTRTFTERPILRTRRRGPPPPRDPLRGSWSAIPGWEAPPIGSSTARLKTRKARRSRLPSSWR